MNKKLKYGLLGAMFTAITFVIPVADAASGVGEDTSNLREATPEVVTERSSTVPVLDDGGGGYHKAMRVQLYYSS